MKEDAFYRQLIYRYQHNQATDEELQLFFQLLNEGKLEPYLTEAMDKAAGVEETPARVKRLFPWRMVAAAVIVLAISGGVWMWFNNRSRQPALAVQQKTSSSTDLGPGGNKAILTLADGKQIVLDNAQNGTITQQGNTLINKQDGQLQYDASQSSSQVVYNTVATPRGGQYQVVLPDGTKVWLNAATTLRFPTVFNGNERRVELNGEAYFEVAKNAARPFRVAIRQAGEVEVLGTHFNIMSYEDENDIMTTLLEGKVKVVNRGSSVVLKPGEQAILTRDAQLTMHNDVDIDAVMAWKNGYFRFNNTHITAIMRQAARWYDAEIIYQGDMTDEFFSGNVPRSANISSLLKILELTKTIRCTVKDRKIIIQPY